MPEAACRGKSADFFFPGPGKKLDIAKLICSFCKVQQDCLDYAVAHDEEGFWGGLSETERRALPLFAIEYIKTEYLRLRLLEERRNIDALILSMRQAAQEALSQEAQSLDQYNVDLMDE